MRLIVLRRKRDRIVLFPATKVLAPHANAGVSRPAFQVHSELQEEYEYLQKFLNLADTALSAWSKLDRRKLA